LNLMKILILLLNFEFFLKFSIGGLYSPTKSLWWLVWSHKIPVVASMDPQNHCGGLYDTTKSLWWPVPHIITVVACMVPQNHCGGLYGPTKSLWWPVYIRLQVFAEYLSNINILIKHCITLVMHSKFEINVWI